MLPAWFPDTVTTDLDRALHYTLQWGLEGLVLRTLGGSRVPDVNEAKLRRRLAETELEAAAVDPGLLEGPFAARAAWLNDLVRLEEAAAFAARVGSRLLIVGGLEGATPEEAAEPLRRAAEAAARHGVRLVVRGEDGWTARRLADHLAGADAAGACWDPERTAAAGEPPLEGLEVLGPRVALVVARRLTDETLPWNDVVRGLYRLGFDGPVCLDATGLRPKGALREATALVYLLRNARRG